jgi:glycosyltransferase involved in cell wall biosynthesis
MTGNSAKAISILGIRGIPAAHGGFETFAEHLAVFLRDRDWSVTVYCQEEGDGPVFEDTWEGIRRVNIPVKGDGPASTIVFDWRATSHAAKEKSGVVLTLGYNTAIFCARLRMAGIRNVINMDGIEWKRAKWGAVAKTWFWMNDWAGCWLGNHLVADHPEIKLHLKTRVPSEKITVIPYEADAVTVADAAPVRELGLNPGRFATVIARAEPENSLLEIVTGFSQEKRGIDLVVLGKYDRNHAYQRRVLDAASDEVKFVGAIYDKAVVSALRFHSMFYVHGHQVGGTNPSLVEALGAGNAILAHDNRFNRWVAGQEQCYFEGAKGAEDAFGRLLQDPERLEQMRVAARERHEAHFTWEKILSEYESLLLG